MDATTLPPRPRIEPAFLGRETLRRLMGPDDYLAAVESAFRAHAEGRTAQPMPLHIAVDRGGFHAKGAFVALEQAVVAVKVNSNFPGNPALGLPTIQGAVLLYDANDGRLLAILDSAEITAMRTAAATALAARYLARRDAGVVAICGCGGQARAQLAAIAGVLSIRRVYAWDADAARAEEFAANMAEVLGRDVTAVLALRDATLAADVVVTATTAQSPFLTRDCVRPGTFVAAVGADSPHKSELHPDLLAHARVVVDSLEQASAMGDLHHAIAAGTMTRADVHAELADLVAGRRIGRTDDAEITIFDSTGLAIQDVASAAVAYGRFIGDGAAKEGA